MTDELYLPEKNRIELLSFTVLDETRVRATVELNIDHQKPCLLLTLVDSMGTLLAKTIILNMYDHHIDFTLHYRSQSAVKPIFLHCATFFKEDQLLNQKSVEILE